MKGYPKFIATKQDYINLLALSDSFNALTQVEAELPVRTGKIGLGEVSLKPAQNRFSAARLTRAENPKELNDILDVCTGAATPDDFRQQAIAELIAIRDVADNRALRTVSIAADGTEVTEEIANSAPLWKIKGFRSRQEVADLIAEYGGEV